MPLDDSIRLERTGMLARYMSEKGHDVVWWASTFDHGEKRYHKDHTTELVVNDHERIVMLHAKRAYKKNISLKRIRYHNLLAKEFHKLNRMYQIPDIILVTWPTRQNAQRAISYGKKLDIPVVIDVKDMWPDIFSRAVPSKLKFAGDIALLPMKLLAKRTFSAADGITGVMPHAVEWACDYAGRKMSTNDRCIFLGNDEIDLPEKDYELQKEWLKELGVDESTWNIAFFSTLSKLSLDLQTAIRVVMNLAEKFPQIRLVIGGKGDDEDRLKEISKGCSNIVFAGWLNEKQMNSIMKMSKCGLYCLRNTMDLKDTFSNKAIQYLSAGLPVVSSLEGFSKEFITENDIGMCYKEGDEDDLREKLMELISNEKSRKRMAENGYDVFENNFKSSVVNEQFERYLLQFI